MSVTVTILGCGSSGGVPRVGQGWGACDPANPRNRRRRCSILVEKRGPGGTTTVLVDTSPDLREQLLDAGVERLDALLMTHSHADHTHGIDDIRPLVIKARRLMPIYMDEETAGRVCATFRYLFEMPAGSLYPPLLERRRLMSGEALTISGPGGDLDVLPFRVHHGEIDALGFRFGGIAYSPDLVDMPPESPPLLAGLDLWIVDALRYTPHPSHLSYTQTLEWIARIGPREAIMTNLHTDLDHNVLAAQLPAHIRPAYDGMRVTTDQVTVDQD